MFTIIVIYVILPVLCMQGMIAIFMVFRKLFVFFSR